MTSLSSVHMQGGCEEGNTTCTSEGKRGKGKDREECVAWGFTEGIAGWIARCSTTRQCAAWVMKMVRLDDQDGVTRGRRVPCDAQVPQGTPFNQLHDDVNTIHPVCVLLFEYLLTALVHGHAIFRFERSSQCPS